jgi:hypothetical protein
VIFPAALVLSLSASLSFFGVALIAAAYVNRDKPEWQRDMRAIIVLAAGFAVLGIVAALLDLVVR